MNWNLNWDVHEEALYERLYDDPLSDPWSISDLLAHHNCLSRLGENTDFKVVVAAVNKILKIIESELGNNSSIIPNELAREGKYPRIRQMRDVHQFDVGTHLAYCSALAIREAPVRYADQNGNPLLSKKMLEVSRFYSNDFLSLMAIAHDAFKCFRSRRALPSKAGKSKKFTWNYPDIEFDRENENEIAAFFLETLIDDKDEAVAMSKAIVISGRIGSILYENLKTQSPTFDGLKKVHNDFDDKDVFLGLYLAVVDALGKGFALYNITVRKNAVINLDTCLKLLLSDFESSIESQTSACP